MTERNGPPSAAPPSAEEIGLFLETEAPRWLRLPNIVGVSVGMKQRRGVVTDESAVIFDVVGKLAGKADVVRAGSRPIPATIAVGSRALPTDVVEGWPEWHGGAGHLARADPLTGGVSVGNRINTGTLGAIVWHEGSAQPVALSNWHVLANRAVEGRTFQPGPKDADADPGSALGRVIAEVFDDRLDAAVSTVGGREVDAAILELGAAVTAVAAPAIGDRVIKSGRLGVTRGIVQSEKRIDMLVDGQFDTHQIQLCVIASDGGAGGPPISAKSDSGSCWMIEKDGAATGTMVGLHVAGDTDLNLAYACPADRVFAKLQLAPLAGRGAAKPGPFMAPEVKPRPSAPFRVIARSLRVRAGPDTSFPRLDARQHGDIVHVIGATNDWLMVDLHGDGKADGYMFGGLLEPVGTQ